MDLGREPVAARRAPHLLEVPAVLGAVRPDAEHDPAGGGPRAQARQSGGERPREHEAEVRDRQGPGHRQHAGDRRAEHYEIAAYRALIAMGEALGYDEACENLGKILREEEGADQKLTRLGAALMEAAQEEAPVGT